MKMKLSECFRKAPESFLMHDSNAVRLAHEEATSNLNASATSTFLGVGGRGRRPIECVFMVQPQPPAPDVCICGKETSSILRAYA